MKLQFGTTQARIVLDQLKRWLPARAGAIDKLVGEARLGIEIELRVIKPAHSDEQRGLYWASLHAFGAWLGYSARETESLLHPLICVETWGQSGTRSFTLRGREYEWPVPAQTSSKDGDGRKRDRETYGALIDTLGRVAAEHGFVIDNRSAECGW